MYFDVFYFYISIPSNDKHVEFRVDVPTQEVLDEAVKDYEISKKKSQQRSTSRASYQATRARNVLSWRSRSRLCCVHL